MSKQSPIALLASLLLLACAGRPADPGESASESAGTGTESAGTSGTGGEPTGGGNTMTAPFDSSGTDGTDGTGTSTGTSVGTISTSTSTTTGASSTGPVEPVTCDPWVEDCPDGMKCMPYSNDGGSNWNDYKCVPIAPQPGQAGDPCTIEGSPVSGLDDCDKHLQCWNWGDDLQGNCVPMCEGTPNRPTCADPNAYCALSGDGVLILCLPSCDPLVQDCATDEETCVPDTHNPHFLCVPLPDGVPPGQQFEPCEFVNQCAPGLVCLDPKVAAECDQNEIGCCVPYCDTTQPNDCPGAGQECVPWFEQDPPPAHVDLGVCAVPAP